MLFRGLVKEGKSIEYFCNKIFKEGRWNDSNLQYRQKWEVNILTVGTKTLLELFITRGSQGPEIPMPARLWSHSKTITVKQSCIGSHNWEVQRWN
jgi:hypothetical protein